MQKSGFAKALCSGARSAKIPIEHDFFAPLIGDWDIWWTDGLQSGTPREVRGEWLFARVLDGYAVQDVFIVSSRAQRPINSQPDAEYGTTIRIYEPASGTWDIFYGCVGTALRLTAHKEAEEIVLVQNGEGGDALRLFRDERGVFFVAEGAAKRCGALAGRRAGACAKKSLAACKKRYTIYF